MLYELIAIVCDSPLLWNFLFSRCTNNLYRSDRAASTKFESKFSWRTPYPSHRAQLLNSFISHPSQMLYSLSYFIYRIARNTGIQVLRSGGVVRGYTNWGTFRLPKPTTKHQARYTEGHHFIMRFDASAPVQSAVQRTLGLDPRMIRFSVIKMGNTLGETKDIDGQIAWTNDQNLADTIPRS